MQRAEGFVQQGGEFVYTSGVASTTEVQQSFPNATVTVYLTGTVTLATIFSDNINTPLANPFTANANGLWFFYAANGRYDVRFSGGGLLAPWTLGDLLLADPFSGGGGFTPPAGQGAQFLRIQPNVTGNTTYQWAYLPELDVGIYNYPSQAPGGTLTGGGGSQTITLVPCPYGVNDGAGNWAPVRLSGGAGTAEVVVPTGGTATSGAASGTIIVSPVNNHSGAWTVTSATAGLQEGVFALGPGGALIINGPIDVYATTNIAWPFKFKGTSANSIISAHASAGTLNILSAVGATGITQTITVSVNNDPTVSDAPSVTVADSSGFSPGDYVFMVGEHTDFTDAYAETSLVLTSAAGVITPRDRVLIRINTSDTVHTIQKFVPVTGVIIEGITFDGAGASGASSARGVFFGYVANCAVRNCKFQNFTASVGAAGFYHIVGYNISCENLEFFNCGNANESDFMIFYCSFAQHRFIRSYLANGFGPQWQGGVGMTITGVLSDGAFDRGMKLAGLGRSTLSGIQSSGPRNATEGVCLALAWRCFSLDISSVQLQGASATYGSLWVQDAQSVTIRGIQIVGSAGSGIQFETAGGTALGAVNVTVSELVTADPIVYNAPASANNLVKWATKFRSKAYSSQGTIVSPANNTWTSIPLDTNAYDVGGIHSTSVNNTRFTAPVTGLYSFVANVVIAGSGAGTLRDVRLFGNGFATLQFTQGVPNASAQTIPCVTSLQMLAGDFVELQFIQDTGGTLAVTGGFQYATSLAVEIVQ